MVLETKPRFSHIFLVLVVLWMLDCVEEAKIVDFQNHPKKRNRAFHDQGSVKKRLSPAFRYLISYQFIPLFHCCNLLGTSSLGFRLCTL